jgi:hypothetical protein
MANDRKQGFLSSLFGKRKPTEEEETAALESKQRLEARIEQALAERAVVHEILAEQSPVALTTKEDEPEPEIELLPISASAMPRRKTPVPSILLISKVEEMNTYAANGR